jgi:hypothetical protein
MEVCCTTVILESPLVNGNSDNHLPLIINPQGPHPHRLRDSGPVARHLEYTTKWMKNIQMAAGGNGK